MRISALFIVPVGLAIAASTGSFCSSVSRKSCKTSGTAFCSSYLGIPAKTTTITTTDTVTVSTTCTAVTGTVTSRVVQTYTRPTTVMTTSTSTVTILSTSTKTETQTGTYTRAVFENFYTFIGGCTTDAPSPGLRKRASSTLSKPPCLSAYPSGSTLSSACSCLSIPTSTSTVTVGKTKTTIVDVPTTVATTVTTTATSTVYKTVSTIITRQTRTLTSTTLTTTTTTTVVNALETYYLVPQYFPLRNEQATSNDNNKAQVIDGGMQFSAGGDGQSFTLAPNHDNTANCTLFSDQGQQAYIDGSDGNELKFGSPSSVTGYVQCLFTNDFEDEGFQLFCRNPASKSYNAGWLDANATWHIPLDSSNATAHIQGYQTGLGG